MFEFYEANFCNEKRRWQRRLYLGIAKEINYRPQSLLFIYFFSILFVDEMNVKSWRFIGNVNRISVTVLYLSNFTSQSRN